MAYQNRVTPCGNIVADPGRGLFTGNRGGRLHDPATRTLLAKRRWASRAWICCLLRFKGRRREVMGPGYTNLFFLDEVTALTAGHRPCYECRRADAVRFAEAWQEAQGLARPPRAPEMDLALHRERLAGAGQLAEAEISALPDGAFLRDPGDGALFAVRGRELLQWSAAGYCAERRRPATRRVAVITPASVLAVLKTGYRPLWHTGAGSAD
jgi:hypothetical protein